jgi:hypothetical protein
MADQEPEANDAQQKYIEVPEEQASTNFFWTLGHTEVFNLQTTLRGNLTEEQIEAHFAMVKWALSHVVTAGGHAKQVGGSPQAVTTVTAGDGKQALASPTPAAAPSPGAPPPTPAPTTPSQGKVNLLIATKMEVEPRADGKVNIKLYGSGHQFPDITKACAPEQAVSLFAETGAWTVAHFAGAATYNVNVAVDYVLSEKLNKAGNPYKNIISIKAA